MRTLGMLECEDCGGRHEIHVNRAGRLIALVACPAAHGSSLSHVARDQVREHLTDAQHRLRAAQRMFQAQDVNFLDLSAQLDEVHRRLSRAQSTIDRHVQGE